MKPAPDGLALHARTPEARQPGLPWIQVAFAGSVTTRLTAPYATPDAPSGRGDLDGGKDDCAVWPGGSAVASEARHG